jgi:hypothetical protein
MKNTQSILDSFEKEFFTKFGADKIWVSPSKENVEVILEIWALFNRTLASHEREIRESVAREERKKWEEVNKIHEEYEKLLIEELEGVISLATAHGWVSDKYEKGVEIRNRLTLAAKTARGNDI